MAVRQVTEEDFPEWLRMRKALYPECSSDQLKAEIESVYFKRTVVGEIDYSVWVEERSPGKLSGFAEISLRADAPQCGTSPVGYVESLFVDADFRRNGVGFKLLSKGQDWILQKNCSEFFVDTDTRCEGAIGFYENFGFQEMFRNKSEILYKKKLR